jgi:FKBP-type peptidyl-prolyl cis-trans isomerase
VYWRPLAVVRTPLFFPFSEKNRKMEAAFLSENGKKRGVLTTASGLQYTALREGDGPKPKTSDQVRVHYRGTLIDGTEF